MNADLAAKVLYAGVDYRKPVGGIAAVENEYAKFIQPYKFVRTCVAGNKLTKALVAAEGLIKFTWKLLTDKEIAIVHVNAASDASFWRKRNIITIAKLFGKKVVYHCHGGGFKRFHSAHPKAVAKVMGKVDCVATLSDMWKEYFTNNFSCRHVEVINNVIPYPTPSPKAGSTNPSSNKTPQPFSLLFLGKITQEKGIYDLIDIISTNKANWEGKLELVIGGNGEVENLLHLINGKGLEKIVRYAGYVSGEVKAELLNHSDAFILPSYYEGLPISILEAMSYGKAIITTNVGGIPSIVTHNGNGYIIKPGDTDSLTLAIQQLISMPEEARRMGKESLDRISPYFPDEVDRQLTRLYKSLLQDQSDSIHAKTNHAHEK